jgi:carbon monoxide dehydrogenase subunit G
MLHFEGDREFTQSLATVYTALADARFLAACVPGVVTVKQAHVKEAVCILRPGFSFIRSTLEVTLRIAEAVPEKSVQIIGHGKGIGSSNDVEVAVALTAADGGCRAHWAADVTNLTGLIKAAPEGLLRGAAQDVIGKVWVEVDKRLAEPAG